MAAKKKVKDELCQGSKKQCLGMKLALKEAGKSAGITWSFMLLGNTMKQVITYQSSKMGAKIMLLNYCPWCGRSIKE